MIYVLLSTYNGEKYLEEQLESLIAQKDVDFKILVRDDGSTDSTHKILNAWQEKSLLTWYTGKNLGAARSFFDLVQKAPDADYYAFCDQDDVWLPEKLSRAVQVLSDMDNLRPSLYCSGYMVVDKYLNEIRTNIRTDVHLTTPSVLLESFVPGCVMVFNRRLKGIVKTNIPECTIYHDRWIFLSAFFCANIRYDEVANIKYRQHENNVIGVTKGSNLKTLWTNFTSPKLAHCPINISSESLRKHYSDIISDDNLKLLHHASNYKRSLSSLFILFMNPNFNVSQGSLLRKIYWKLQILMYNI